MTSTVLPEGQLSEITCQRSVAGANFASGNQDFVFSLGAPNCIIPEQCYFVIDATLTASGRQPLMTDHVAMAQDMGSSLYNNAYFRMGGQDVSSVVNFLGQTGIMKKRLSKTHAWRESMGNSVQMLEPSFEKRQQKTAYDGNRDFTTLQLHRGNGAGASTVAITTAGVVTGVNTLWNTGDTALFAGDIITVDGMNLSVEIVTNDTTVTVQHENTPLASVAVTATTNYEIHRIVTDNETNGNNRQFILWQPPLGVFQHAEPLGAGDYRISLNPNSDYKKAAVEAASALSVGSSAGEFDLVINDVKLYIATYKHTIPDRVTSMRLMECLTQSKALSGNTESFQFTVPPSTLGIGWFVQANAAGADTRYPSTLFTTQGAEQNSITDYQITYANVTVPQTRWSAHFDETGTYPAQVKRLTLQQRYHDTFAETGLAKSDSGCETLEQWLDSGQMVYHSFVRDSENRSTQVQFTITSSGSYSIATNLYLVAFYRREVEVTSDAGLITGVRSLNI